MTKRAVLDVQLIGQTLFTPPVDADGEDLFEPDEANDIAVGPFDRSFDGSGLAEFAGRSCYQSFHKPNAKTATNRGYLAHILESGHLSVLEHATATFYIQGVSRSLTHELIRHRHLSPSQLSQRYVDSSEVRFVIPPIIEEWLADYVDDSIAAQGALTHPDTGEPLARVDAIASICEDYAARQLEAPIIEYNDIVGLLNNELPEAKRKQIREAARSALPNGVETKIVLTGNYRAWITFLQQRDSPAADAEIARLARTIRRRLIELAPAVFDDEAKKYWTVGEEA